MQETYVKEQVTAGKPLSQALADAASLYPWPNNSGNVLVLGGAQLTVDWTAPEGSRIKEFKLVKGGELDDAATYCVAMNSFVARGGDGDYAAFASSEIDKEWGTCEMTLRDFVASADWESRVVELTGATGTAI